MSKCNRYGTKTQMSLLFSPDFRYWKSNQHLGTWWISKSFSNIGCRKIYLLHPTQLWRFERFLLKGSMEMTNLGSQTPDHPLFYREIRLEVMQTVDDRNIKSNEGPHQCADLRSFLRKTWLKSWSSPDGLIWKLSSYSVIVYVEKKDTCMTSSQLFASLLFSFVGDWTEQKRSLTDIDTFQPQGVEGLWLSMVLLLDKMFTEAESFWVMVLSLLVRYKSEEAAEFF